MNENVKKMLIEQMVPYLQGISKSNKALAEGMKRKDKSNEGLAEYLCKRMEAEYISQNGRKTGGVGMDGDKLVELATHYYCENDKDLEAEIKAMNRPKQTTNPSKDNTSNGKGKKKAEEKKSNTIQFIPNNVATSKQDDTDDTDYELMAELFAERDGDKELMTELFGDSCDSLFDDDSDDKELLNDLFSED